MRTSRETPIGLLCRFAVAAARRREVHARAALAELRRMRVPRVAVEESALMLVLYGGFPAALEALRALQSRWPAPRRVRSERDAWRARGERLCRRVYGAKYPRLVAAVRALHPDLATWMLEFGYGRVLSRPGLSARDRELVTVAVLAATGWRRQLLSHLLGAARLGALPFDLRVAFRAGVRMADGAARAAAGAAWNEAFGGRDPRSAIRARVRPHDRRAPRAGGSPRARRPPAGDA